MMNNADNFPASNESTLSPEYGRKKPEPFNGYFYKQDFISVNQLTSIEELKRIFDIADEMEYDVLHPERGLHLLDNITIVELFYQPSTRTSTSFEAAGKKEGAIVVVRDGMEKFSSAIKGENEPDTIRAVIQTTHPQAIALRHSDDDSSEVAAYYSNVPAAISASGEVEHVPIINAGSGKREHPTQAILDLYTIYCRMGRDFEQLKNLTLTFVGDMKHGRTIKSLGSLLALVNEQLGGSMKINLVSPEPLQLSNGTDEDRQLLESWAAKGITVQEFNHLDEEMVAATSVMYDTRIQKEWFEDNMGLYEDIKDEFIITPEIMEWADPDMLLMHPLPRVNEISPELDDYDNAVYINEEMRRGLYTRMALIALVTIPPEELEQKVFGWKDHGEGIAYV